MSNYSSPVPRLVPDRTLPDYSYVPGRFPHPESDPGGHSHGVSRHKAAALTESSWPECEHYLWGIDLFNSGYYWEAHESWEQVWLACGRSGQAASFLKGLIKLAAAGVKAREGRAAGVARHATRAGELFRQAAAQGAPPSTCFGLPLSDLISVSARVSQHPDEFVNTGGDRVVRVMPLVLRVQRRP